VVTKSPPLPLNGVRTRLVVRFSRPHVPLDLFLGEVPEANCGRIQQGVLRGSGHQGKSGVHPVRPPGEPAQHHRGVAGTGGFSEDLPPELYHRIRGENRVPGTAPRHLPGFVRGGAKGEGRWYATGGR